MTNVQETIKINTKKVLVIDDNKVNLELIKLLLIHNDFFVIEAESGEEGIKLAKLEKPDIILLDIMMPDIDGFDVFKIIKSYIELEDTPIIFLTANHSREFLKKGIELGADDYIYKPYNDVELLLRINQHIKGKELLKSLRESQRNYETLFNSMISGFAHHRIVLDANNEPIDYIFLNINESFEKLTGLKKEDVVGRSVKDVLPETEDIWIKNYGKVALTMEPLKFESYSKEIEKYFDVYAFSPKYGEFAVVFNDITEKKLSEMKVIEHNQTLQELINEKTAKLKISLEKEKKLTKELSEALIEEKRFSDLKSRFVSMASHEFRTPLTSIQTTVDLLTNYIEKYEKEKIIDKLRGIKDSVIYLSKIIEEVIILNKDNKSHIKYENIKLKNFIETIVFDISVIDNNKHNISINLEDQGLTISIDATRLKMILTNLLSNAVKYSKEGTEIKLNIKFYEDNLRFEVIDQGIGIPEDDINKLFNPFQRCSNVGDIKGTGLGLAIVKNQVEQMDGKIYLDKDYKNGCKFIVDFDRSIVV